MYTRPTILLLQHPLYGRGPEGAFVSQGPQASLMRFPTGFSPLVSSPGQPSTPGVFIMHLLCVCVYKYVCRA